MSTFLLDLHSIWSVPRFLKQMSIFWREYLKIFSKWFALIKKIYMSQKYDTSIFIEYIIYSYKIRYNNIRLFYNNVVWNILMLLMLIVRYLFKSKIYLKSIYLKKILYSSKILFSIKCTYVPLHLESKIVLPHKVPEKKMNNIHIISYQTTFTLCSIKV